MKYVIIGNSAAAIGAVEGIRKIDKTSTIKLLSDEPYHTYSRPLISYYLAGKVVEENMSYREKDFYEKNNIEAILGVKAQSINTVEGYVALENGKKIDFEKLLIATGGTPFVPPIKGVDKENVFTFLKLAEVKKIKTKLNKGSKAVIIGAGLIGLKAAEALVQLGIEVTVVELANRVLPTILDDEGAAIVQAHLEAQGVKFELNISVAEITGKEIATGVILSDGREEASDLVIVAVGVRPNIAVVQNSAIRVDKGIVIDEHCQTNIENIYAAGDVAQGYDLIYQEQRLLPILPNAYKQGEVAGQCMAGENAVFTGGFAMNAIGFFNLPMITAGIIKPEGADYEVLVKSFPEKQSYKKIVLKDNQVVGFIYLNSIDRAGIMTSLITGQNNVEKFKSELLKDDFGYIDLPQDLRIKRLWEGGVA